MIVAASTSAALPPRSSEKQRQRRIRPVVQNEAFTTVALLLGLRERMPWLLALGQWAQWAALRTGWGATDSALDR
jgi:hypothetical protein